MAGPARTPAASSAINGAEAGPSADALDTEHVNLGASVADVEALRARLGLDRMTLVGRSRGAMPTVRTQADDSRACVTRHTR